MAEWSKAHVWSTCDQKWSQSSNLCLTDHPFWARMIQKPQSYKATIHSLDYSPNRQVVFLRVHIQGSEFVFSEGQFVMIQCPINGSIVKKAYSIATTMDEYVSQGTIGFIIKLVPGGGFTTHLFHSMQLGDICEIIWPLGHMILPSQTQDKEFVFISTGSWLSPLYGMFQKLIDNGHYKSVVQLYGEKTQDRLIPQTLDILCKSSDRIISKICLSREQESRLPNSYYWYVWQCLTDVMTQCDRPEDRIYYLCGRPDIVDSLIVQLQSYKVAKNNILFEKY